MPIIPKTVDIPSARVVAAPSNGVTEYVEDDPADAEGVGATYLFVAELGAGAPGGDVGAAGGVETADGPGALVAATIGPEPGPDGAAEGMGMVKTAVKGAGPGHTVQTVVVTVNPCGT